jgi:hypothetical protein
MLAPRSPCLPREDEDFHEQTAREALIIFLPTYGRPHQMTFDRDPRSRWWQRRARFPFSFAPALALFGDRTQHLSKASARQKRIGRKIPSKLRPRVLTAAPESLACLRCVRSLLPCLTHYNWERPHQGRACHNVPPRVAFPRRPSLPALPERVDPDRWLVTFDHHMFLRRVGRDGCQSARPGSLLHPSPTGRGPDPHAGWKPKTPSWWSGMRKRRIKKLPLKGLVRQEMAIDDYLKYIRAEALAYERRCSTRSSGWGLRQPALW